MVSIHAPREGCDYTELLRELREIAFQFTHPGRGTTVKGFQMVAERPVSIHAPREGCDGHQEQSEEGQGCFNSRTPGGVRPRTFGAVRLLRRFQFTHPGRGATGVGV